MPASFLGRFFTYQQERFPVVVLFLMSLAVAASSAAVVSAGSPFFSLLVVSAAGVLYLFHIRVVDEIRDYRHDLAYHDERPIPRGVISLAELRGLDYGAVLLFLGLALYLGSATFFWALLALAYTFVAGREFFVGEKLRARFLLYNAVNLVQMILLQFFVYSAFSAYWPASREAWLHCAFVFLNVVILEIVRKIKTESEETAGHDTYSWHLGYQSSLALIVFLAGASSGAVLWLLRSGGQAGGVAILILFFLVMQLGFVLYRRSRYRTKNTERELSLGVLITYIGMNTLIIYSL